jgi:hypothetical protein
MPISKKTVRYHANNQIQLSTRKTWFHLLVRVVYFCLSVVISPNAFLKAICYWTFKQFSWGTFPVSGVTYAQGIKIV